MLYVNAVQNLRRRILTGLDSYYDAFQVFENLELQYIGLHKFDHSRKNGQALLKLFQSVNYL